MENTPRVGVGFWVLAAIAGAAACGGAGEDRPAARPADGRPAADDESPARGYEVVPVPDGGTITGVVVFDGTVPPPQTIAVGDGAEACGATQPVQPLRVAPGGALADVVVSVADIPSGVGFVQPETPLLLDQVECQFVPRVMIVPVGTAVTVRNSDPLTHNVHTAAFENRPVNRSQPPGGPALSLDFSAPELVHIRCDLHPWMGAWIAVVDHPYNALTGPDGRFAIENIPPGTYRITTWHESLGRTTREVVVAAEDVSELIIRVAPSASAP